MIPIFSAINEVAVIGTTCVVLAVHTLWYAIPVSSADEKLNSHHTPQPKIGAIALTCIGYMLLVGFVAYALSFSSQLHMSILQIGAALALFAVAAQVSLYSPQSRSFLSLIHNAGFMVVCIIGSAYVLNYWPW